MSVTAVSTRATSAVATSFSYISPTSTYNIATEPFYSSLTHYEATAGIYTDPASESSYFASLSSSIYASLIAGGFDESSYLASISSSYYAVVGSRTSSPYNLAPTGVTSASNTNTNQSQLSTGAKVGIGLGVGLGVLFLGALVLGVFLLLRRRRKRNAASHPTNPSSYGASPPVYPPGLAAKQPDALPKHELAGVYAASNNYNGKPELGPTEATRLPVEEYSGKPELSATQPASNYAGKPELPVTSPTRKPVATAAGSTTAAAAADEPVELSANVNPSELSSWDRYHPEGRVELHGSHS